ASEAVMHNRYEHVLRAFFDQPMAILPEKLREIRAFLHRLVTEGPLPTEERAAVSRQRRALELGGGSDLFAQSPRRAPSAGVQMAGRVAVVPIFGVVAQRVSLLEESSGWVSTEVLGAAIDGLVADRHVRAIVLAFDSPGGSIYGVSELAAKIRAARSD